MKEIKIRPIGIVKNNVKQHKYGGFLKEVSEIILDKRYAKGLDNIEDYSHVVVVYWMDKVKNYVTKHRPQGNKEVPEVGIFACRCPARPNPIAITTVKLIKRNKNKIIVEGLDVLNNTPVLDIKPYWSQYDLAENAKVPEWVCKLKF
ncbi:tRNA (N6-threonylcarbamoyladenosine(37)-N6)-methyltransferase TrmO [Candidatus Pacearchaeota archaeon]|nr:tRNA (N6-threonylcarbamoyladenosine(37)-N6)-methyltransferase TrmO [Candidatus Pacearchaeota archaeon]